jgi:hypothetical protein
MEELSRYEAKEDGQTQSKEFLSTTRNAVSALDLALQMRWTAFLLSSLSVLGTFIRLRIDSYKRYSLAVYHIDINSRGHSG